MSDFSTRIYFLIWVILATRAFPHPFFVMLKMYILDMTLHVKKIPESSLCSWASKIFQILHSSFSTEI